MRAIARFACEFRQLAIDLGAWWWAGYFAVFALWFVVYLLLSHS